MILKEDGSVWSCGLNTDGQLGNPHVNHESEGYKQTTISSGAISIAAGVVYSLVLKEDDSVWMTGKKIGLSDKPPRKAFVFEQVIEGAQDVAAGSGHSIVLSRQGSVWAMGQNRFNQ